MAGFTLWLPSAMAERSSDGAAAPGAAALLGAAGTSARATPPAHATPSARATPSATSAAAPSGSFVPALARIRTDLAAPYADGCHQDWSGTDVPPCTYGVPDAPRTMVLYGDSHAATWFPALDVIAHQRDWRLIDLTKSACPVADTTVYGSRLMRGYTECDTWRDAAMARIASLKPDLVVTTGRTDYSVMSGGSKLGPSASASALSAALTRTYRQLDKVAGTVVVLRDNPMPGTDMVECLARHQDSPSDCDRSVSQLKREPRIESAAASAASVDYVETASMFCRPTVCPTVIGGVVVWRDGNHATATYTSTLAPYLTAALTKVGALA